jgi:hypothetical protein
MPTDAEHLNQGNHNIEFLSFFYADTRFNDWAVTVAFYSALHIVEYVIFKQKSVSYQSNALNILHSNGYFRAIVGARLPLPKGCSPDSSDHKARRFIVRENFQEIAGQYYRLFNNSHTARYRCYSWDRLQVEQMVKTDLHNIISWANNKYGASFIEPNVS